MTIRNILFLIIVLGIQGSLWAQVDGATLKSQDVWSVPKNVQEVGDMLKEVDKEIASLAQDEKKKERLETLTKQKGVLEALAKVMTETAGLEAASNNLKDRAKKKSEELAEEKGRKKRDGLMTANLTIKDLNEAKKKVDDLNADIGRAHSLVEAAEKKVDQLTKRLESSLRDIQKIPLETASQARSAFEEAKAEDPVAKNLLLSKLHLAQLQLELVTRNRDRDEKLKDLGSLADEVRIAKLDESILKRKLEIAAAEQEDIRNRVSELAEEARERGRFDIEALEKEVAALQESEDYKRPWLELRLERAKLRDATNRFQKECGDFSEAIDGRGAFVAMEPVVTTLADRIQAFIENPAEDVLPRTADGLRASRDEAKQRSRAMLTNLHDIRERLPLVSDILGNATREQKSLDERIADARATYEAGRKKSPIQYLEVVPDWVSLENDLVAAHNEYRTLIDGFLSKLKQDLRKWEDLQDRSDANVQFLTRELLWTREESNVSIESMERALRDLSQAAGNLGGLISEASHGAVSFLFEEKNRLRTGIAFLFILVVGFAFVRLHLRLPKTWGWLDAQAHEGKNYYLILGIILRRTHVSLMLAVVFVGAPLIVGFDRGLVELAACVFAVPFLYRLGRVTLDVFVLPGKDEERVFNLDEDLARTLHRAGRWLLNLAVVFVPAAVLLEFVGYGKTNPGFLELWWLTYESLSHAILLFSVFRPAVVSNIIRGGGVVAISVKTWILILYPLVVGAVLFLFVLGSLRYLEAEQFFQTLLLKSLGVLFFSYLGYRLLLAKVTKGQDLSREPNPEDFENDKDFVTVGRELFFGRLTRTFIRLAFAVPAIFLIVRFWDEFDMPFLEWGIFGEGTVTTKDFLKAFIAFIITTAIVRTIRQSLAYVILPKTDLDKGLRYTVSMLATYALWTLGMVVILNIIKIRGEHIAVFTGALAFGIGFGLQSIVKNFVSGLILLIERPVKVGDKIDVGNKGGSVEKITLRATTVMTWDGTGIVIPNETMVGGTLTNHSLGHPRLRSSLLVGVGYGSDVKRVREILTETVKGHGLTLKRPAPEAFFMGFGDSSLDFQVRYWTRMSTHRLRVISDLRFAIEEAFRRENIEIPFPQRDLNIRSVDGDVMGAFGGNQGVELDPELEDHEEQ